MVKAMSGSSHPRRSKWSTWVVGALLSCALSLASFSWLKQQRERAAMEQADRVASALQVSLATPVESLHAAVAFLEALDDRGTSQAQFSRMAGHLVRRHPETVAIEWIARVPSALRGTFEAAVRQDQPGYSMREPTRGGDMVEAVHRALHFPLVYAEPLNPAIHGLDIAFDEARTLPIRRAFERHTVTLSDRYQLVEDPEGVYSVVAYAPVERAAWRPGLPEELKQGVVVGLFRLGPLFEHALRGTDFRRANLEIGDPAAAEPLRVLYRQGQLNRDASFTRNVAFVDRTYQLVIEPHRQSIGLWPSVVLVLGLVLTGLFHAHESALRRTRALERRLAQLGQYTIEAEIAKGGMGTVYRARHALLRRQTAIKIQNTPDVTEFEREATVTCLLTHPNTISVYDFGKGEDGTCYLAMEYVEGYQLEELVELAGPLPPARALRILLQVAGSLAEAHERGLVHRDVKPRNIMVTERAGLWDFVKVLDFGLAHRNQVEQREGASGIFEGTPGYAAPEVVRGAVATPQSDIFSLGCVAYYLLSGKPAFQLRGSPTSAALCVLTEVPAALPETVPARVAELVRACLAKSPAERPASMPRLAAQLREAQAECAPWTQAAAEAWWRQHPPARATRRTSDAQRTFSVVLDSRERVTAGSSGIVATRESPRAELAQK